MGGRTSLEMSRLYALPQVRAYVTYYVAAIMR
jgi:hypothetical protein